MLEHLPQGVGHALRGWRPGIEKIVFHRVDAGSCGRTLTVTSNAFEDGGAIPIRFTADGARVSPPLTWSGVPAESQCVVVLIEDADSPTPQPLVHALVWNLPGRDGALAQGAMEGEPAGPGATGLGRNSYFQHRYLPPDPPPGHGPHRYAIQVFALARRPSLRQPPGRNALLDVLDGNIVASGLLTGTYERGVGEG